MTASDPPWRTDATRSGVWAGVRVVVAGIGVSGTPAALALAARDAAVLAVDSGAGVAEAERVARLEAAGVRVRLGDADTLPAGTELVVTSPGFRPDHPLMRAATAQSVPVWGEVELAWRFSNTPTGPPPAWLAITGTNGKTTTVEMVAAMLTSAGLRTVAAGNVGLPVIDAALAGPPYDVLAVELSSFQLHWSESVRARASAVLNIAPDHLDWHGSLAAYAADKAKIYRGAQRAVVFNGADPLTADLARAAEVAPDCRVVGFSVGAPERGELGLVEDLLVDRAFGEPGEGVELASIGDVSPLAPHNVANALAAAALVRAHGVEPAAVRDGLRAFHAGAHRIANVATVAGVSYVDDSKATNGHAATASLLAFDHVVWVAGGLAKGATFDEVVIAARDRLRAAVLLGRDRALIREALARHAPEVPVVEVAAADTKAMDHVVWAAQSLARPGDTVLLAPACASMDMFGDYAERGDAFAAAVARLTHSSSAAEQI